MLIRKIQLGHHEVVCLALESPLGQERADDDVALVTRAREELGELPCRTSLRFDDEDPRHRGLILPQRGKGGGSRKGGKR